MNPRKNAPAHFAPLLTIPLFIAAIVFIHQELQVHHYRDVVEALDALPAPAIAMAVGLTVLNFLSLTTYDALALRFIGHRLPYRCIALASFIGYAFSNALGFSLLTGVPIRYRLYSGWGLSAPQITSVVGFYMTTFLLGIATVSGLVFLLEPLRLPGQLHLPWANARPLGVVLLSLTAVYLFLGFVRTEPVRIRGLQIPLAHPPLSFLQLVLGALDWPLASAVAYVLLPAGHGLSYPMFLGIFLLAQLAGLLSNIPGGLGVFEAVVLFFMPASVSGGAILGSLLAYRLIYYLLPLLAASVALGAYEYRSNLRPIGRWGMRLGQGLRFVAPQALAMATFVAGLVLLLSGSTPAIEPRIQWLNRILPLPLIELSHFLASVLGSALLILAWGIRRRLDAAYYLSAGMLAAAIVLSLLKGLDYEEAALLAVVLAALLASRREFYRKASLLNEPLSPRWISAVAIALLSAVGLGVFSYKHVDYSNELWWQFALHADAPRSLRAAIGAVTVILGFAMLRLLHPARPAPLQPSRDELDSAGLIAAAFPYTYAHLVLTGDKSVLFGPGRRSFLMYAVEGRSWVAFGDPVGRREDQVELAWRFRELVDRYDGWTVFYQVRPENLPLYLDLGLALVKLGEEARVFLPDFSLDGRERKAMRHTLHTMDREDCTFEIVPPEDVPPLIPELKLVSDDWLRHKNTSEKGFSLGYFEPDYLCRLPVALVRRSGRIVAFANVLPGEGHEELSVDLTRYSAEAPKHAMDYLFLRLMLWGKAHDYRWFSLGMAPLSGLQNRPLSPLWNRFGAAVFRHGEHFYNFQGLRAYKEKFAPQWEPRYLAAPSGLVTARILANVSVLIGGSLRGVLMK